METFKPTFLIKIDWLTLSAEITQEIASIGGVFHPRGISRRARILQVLKGTGKP